MTPGCRPEDDLGGMSSACSASMASEGSGLTSTGSPPQTLVFDRGSTGDGDPPGLQPGLQAAAGMFREQPGEGLVGAHPGAFVRIDSRCGEGAGWAIIDPVFFQRVFNGAFHPA